MTKRFREWKNINQKMITENKKGHDALDSEEVQMFNSKFAKKEISVEEVKILKSLITTCSCENCLLFLKKHIMELELQLCYTTVKVFKKCMICGKDAKSNKALLCESKNCYNIKKLQSKPIKIRNITSLCVICGKLAKRNGAKICEDKNCYNQHHRNLLNIRLKNNNQKKNITHK